MRKMQGRYIVPNDDWVEAFFILFEMFWPAILAALLVILVVIVTGIFQSRESCLDLGSVYNLSGSEIRWSIPAGCEVVSAGGRWVPADMVVFGGY
jgi:hypothetical protein